jgi:hypothetical protein
MVDKNRASILGGMLERLTGQAPPPGEGVEPGCSPEPMHAGVGGQSSEDRKLELLKGMLARLGK